MHRFFLSVLCLLFCVGLPAQQGPRSHVQGHEPGSPTGKYYGKIIDHDSKKGIAYAVVQIWTSKDPATGESKLINGQLTDEKGEFFIESIPVFSEHILKVSHLGYASLEKKVSFNISRSGRPDQASLLKDLGNIDLQISAAALEEIEITSTVNTVSLALDKKVYKLSKNALTAGGTAEDALRNIPTVNVDIDGNVSVRNAAPEIFVDGRPTPLSIDQIPADDIEQIELITSPSAKFDAASGGSSGIINIVLKKNKKGGLNGSVRLSGDSNTGFNTGGDINFRQGKINTFVNANFNRRVSIGHSHTYRQTFNDAPPLHISQNSNQFNEGSTSNFRAGVDYFANNRNTLTLMANTGLIRFNPEDDVNIITDSLYNGLTKQAASHRTSKLSRKPRPFGVQLLYKYLFPVEGKEWSADLNLNGNNFSGDGHFRNVFFDTQLESRQIQQISSKTKFGIFQTDFTTPLPNNRKFEAGARISLRNYKSQNDIRQLDRSSGLYEPAPQFANKYQYSDDVYAVYATYLKSYTKWGYQLGLRIESSHYKGTLPDLDTSFTNEYPFALFPSLHLSYKLSENDQFLLNYSRKINRPGFFQLLPYEDFTDSLLLSRGHPGLRPEFVNNLELSYQKIFKDGSNFLASVFSRYLTDLITRYQFSEFNPTINRNVLVTSFINANSSTAIGLEMNYRCTLFKIFETNTNFNAYHAFVNGRNIDSASTNRQHTFSFKENAAIRFAYSWSVQINGEYQSRAAFINDGSGGGGGGPFSFTSSGRGGGGQGGASFGRGDLASTVQGYTRPFWSIDIAVRKEFWNRMASLNIGIQDIFATRVRGFYSATPVFIQDGTRIRDPRLIRINFSWRFGKTDAALFKRKNERPSGENIEIL